MGELHLEVIIDRLKREFSVEANVGKPQIAYRETITTRAADGEGLLKKQTGGRGQYGHVVLEVRTRRTKRVQGPEHKEPGGGRSDSEGIHQCGHALE